MDNLQRTQIYRMATIIFLLIGSLALLSGCLPDPLEVKGIPKPKPKIVVSTQIVPNQSLVVLLTKSFGALEGNQNSDPEELLSQIAVTDATALIKGPSTIDTLVNLGNGFYGGISFSFREGERYELSVDSETMGRVKATSNVLRQIDFEEAMAELSFNGFDDTLVRVTYKALDPIGKNQYMLNVQRFRANEVLLDLINPRAFLKLLTDAGFEGKEFSESFRAFPRNYQPGDTVAVSLSNISEEYYRFLKLREDNRFGFVEFLGEPTNYPSNVEGGLGYFNLFVPSVRFFVLE
jgi:Domain of unknown function (DUF4249)